MRDLWACASSVVEQATKQPDAPTLSTTPQIADHTVTGYGQVPNTWPRRTPTLPHQTQCSGTPPSTSVNMDPTTEMCKADKTRPTMVSSQLQIMVKISTGTDTLKPNPTGMEHTPTQPCQPYDSPHQQVKEIPFLVGNLISVPILYGLDRDALNEGHITRLTPHDTSCSFAWDMGPSVINTNIATTWKSPTLT